MTRRTSSTFRPTESEVIETYWMTLPGSITKVARSAVPSARLTPQATMRSRLVSASMGKGTVFRSSFWARHWKWQNSLSPETPRICTSRSSNSPLSLPKAAISVGQTKVKSLGQKKTTRHLPGWLSSVISSK